jgi:UDP-N-acetylglucosamine--N-acetylmuramyl-(pentapeptide) pyrophosphoryl-undecaprenol N-acetylglucosamine transferase
MKIDSPKILIAAGGTGGHIFPAIHVAKAILNQSPKAEISFVGTGRPLEEKLIVGAGFPLSTIKVTGVAGRGFKGIIEFLYHLPGAVWSVVKLIKSKKPDIVFGFGGYGSVLPVTIARLLGIKTWIHEAEASPGLANKFLGSISHKISTAFPNKVFAAKKVIHSGHPVRSDLLSVNKLKKIGSPARILVVGGSQGARALDNAVIELAPRLKSLDIEIVHQTRPENLGVVDLALKNAGVRAQVVNFIQDMAKAYEESDIIIARSGAGTVAEIAVVNRPTIFVPLPSSQGGHQYVNAEVLASIGKAKIVNEGEGFSDKLYETLKDLLAPSSYDKMIQAPGSGQSLDAATVIANESLKLLD